VILPKLDNGIRFGIKFTETSEELLKKLTVSNHIFHRRTLVRDVIVHAAVAVRVRHIQRKGVTRRVILAADAIAVTLPDEAVRAHASAVVLFLVTDAGRFSIEGIVLLLCDRNLLTGATDVDEILLYFF
jgi:hypothetical protein